MRVELRLEARNDLTAGALFYDQQRSGLGDHFIDCLFDDLSSLESEGGVHEKVYGLHRKLSQRFPFAIYYCITESVVDVMAILDCRRDPTAIEHRLKQVGP